jgi:ABC-type phosphate transport system substrate-binding protein
MRGPVGRAGGDDIPPNAERTASVRTSRFRRALGVSLVAASAIATLLVAAPPIVASTPPPAHTDVLAAAGSDTIQSFMNDYFNTTAAKAVDPNTFNVLVPVNITSPFNVPADANCGAQGYIGSGMTPTGTQIISPNGSGQGRTALKGAVAGTYPGNTTANGPGGTLKGCIDIARSSGGPQAVPTDNPTFEYYAFALDAVTWGSPSLQAPATMTVQNLRDIYNCVITNWNQLPGGGTGQIQRFMPQTGSGTRSFFISNVLNGIDPDTVSNANCPANKDTMEENTGTDLYTPNPLDPSGGNSALYQNAIVPYSAGKFVFQATNSTNPTLDVRGGIRPGGLTQGGTPVYGVRWTGSAWLLNNATVVGGRTVTDAVTNGGTGSPPPSPIVTSATANFTAADVGFTVSGTNIPPGAVISSVDSATQIHISIPTIASATGGTLTIGSAVVSEKNPNILTATDSSVYPGVRYVYNVIDSTEPSYTAARDVIGFNDTSGGAASPLCANNASIISVIRSNGFLDLPSLTSPGGNTNITCRLRTPS